MDKNLRINEQIRTLNVRVIDASGKQLGILNIHRAIKEALQVGLDLVEVSPNTLPPVCRIMDYGKFCYQQSKKIQLAKKNVSTIQLKEIRLRPKTEEHDLQTKIKHISKFLGQNNKVKITMVFRGREIIYTENGKSILNEIKKQLEDISNLYQPPRLEGRNMIMILTPKK